MKRILYPVLIASAFYVGSSHPAAAQAKLVEKVTADGKNLVIPYEKYVLPNGLTLIVHEDHSDPIVHVDVTYHVGSAREEIGKSGFAHFFEHMMFQGSDNVGDDQHFRIITEAGGTTNGTTNRDRTNYFETVPDNALERMLWLEADRMGFLLDAVTQQKFEVQRATVKNERGQRYDNVPYGLAREIVAKNLYPYGHPYSWLTIGYVEDLNRVTLADLKNFFLRWYGPNNAVLTVGGNVNTKQVVALTEKYFGSIPRGPEVAPMKLPAPVVENDRYVSMIDNYAKIPMLRMVFPTVPAYHKDEAALDCLAEIIGQGNNSILYKNLVKTRKATNASSFHDASELAGEFTFVVSVYPGQNLADIEQTVRASLEEFEKRGVTEDDIVKFRNSFEAGLINRMESVSGKVAQLAAYHTFTGDANYLAKDLKRYTSVTRADVMRVYRQYIKGRHGVILSVLPKGLDLAPAAPDNFTVSSEGYKAPDYGYAGLTYVKAKDTFDRSVMPPNGDNPVVTVPDYWRETLPGNIRVIGTHSREVPVVHLTLNFKGGKMADASYPGKAGLANLFASMMDEDTKNYTAAAFSTELEKLGSRISVSVGRDAIEVRVRSLRKHLDKTLALLEERLLRSEFTEEAFAINKQRIAENLKNQRNQPVHIANKVFGMVNFGKDNVLGWPASGTEATVAAITLDDVRDFYRNYFSFRDAKVIIVGDISKQELLPKLGFLQKMPGHEVKLRELPPVPEVEKTKIYFVHVPGAAQTEFRIGRVTGMKYDALGDYYRSTVMNYPLGGSFNSRLNMDLREDKGWTYGARAYFEGDEYTGTYAFSAGIKAEATDSAMHDVFQILAEYREKGITPEELRFTQSSMGQSDARKYETGSQKAGFLAQILTYDLPADYAAKQNELLRQMGVSEANALAAKYLPDVGKLNVVLVGDRKKVGEGLRKLGYEVVELDSEGNVVQ
jgi:zinc protease